MLWSRVDGTLVRKLPRLRRFMPLISPRRNDSLVYFETEIEVDNAIEFLAKHNGAVPRARRITLFHLILRSFATALHERPAMNRFTAGGRLWQRRGVWITFSAKQEMRDGSPIVTIKREFSPDESLEQMAAGVREELHDRRSGKTSRADREMGLALLLPATVIRLGLLLVRGLDWLGALPRWWIDDDPLYASMFVANLGSVGLDAAYHHLWEYGTCPIFAVVGRMHRRSGGPRVVTIQYSFDERIEDGLYAALTLRGVKERLETPELLV